MPQIKLIRHLPAWRCRTLTDAPVDVCLRRPTLAERMRFEHEAAPVLETLFEPDVPTIWEHDTLESTYAYLAELVTRCVMADGDAPRFDDGAGDEHVDMGAGWLHLLGAGQLGDLLAHVILYASAADSGEGYEAFHARVFTRPAPAPAPTPEQAEAPADAPASDAA